MGVEGIELWFGTSSYSSLSSFVHPLTRERIAPTAETPPPWTLPMPSNATTRAYTIETFRHSRGHQCNIRDQVEEATPTRYKSGAKAVGFENTSVLSVPATKPSKVAR